MSFRVGTPVVVVKPVTVEQTMLGWTGVVAGKEMRAGEEVQDPRDGMTYIMPKRATPVLVDGGIGNTPWMIFSECLRKIEDPDTKKAVFIVDDGIEEIELNALEEEGLGRKTIRTKR